jgi:hypothetical protein
MNKLQIAALIVATMTVLVGYTSCPSPSPVVDATIIDANVDGGIDTGDTAVFDVWIDKSILPDVFSDQINTFDVNVSDAFILLDAILATDYDKACANMAKLGCTVQSNCATTFQQAATSTFFIVTPLTAKCAIAATTKAAVQKCSGIACK